MFVGKVEPFIQKRMKTVLLDLKYIYVFDLIINSVEHDAGTWTYLIAKKST